MFNPDINITTRFSKYHEQLRSSHASTMDGLDFRYPLPGGKHMAIGFSIAIFAGGVL